MSEKSKQMYFEIKSTISSEGYRNEDVLSKERDCVDVADSMRLTQSCGESFDLWVMNSNPI
jgi:hypothetical protein